VRRALLLTALATLLAALTSCSSKDAGNSLASGRHAIDVGTRAMVAFKRHTQIPDCPAVSSQGVDRGMPGVTLPCLGGGRAVDVAGLRGPMIVNFWASWCGACRDEMPALAAYARAHPSVKVLGIDFLDPQPGAALQLAKNSHVGYPLIADTTGALDRASPLPKIPGLPYTVFLAGDGSIAHIEARPMRTEADVATAAHQYLGVGG
jgi:thiol-disulfide isomerase/thioredoxin